MPEPTLEELKTQLIKALNELTELLKRLEAKLSRGQLASNSQTSGYQTTLWSPAQSNEDTTDSDLDGLNVTDLDTWLGENKAEVERLQEPM